MIEEWMPVPGYEGLFEASNLGRVRSLDRISLSRAANPWLHKGKVLAAQKTPRGYMRVVLTDKDHLRRTVNVHSVVANTFLPKDRIDRTDVNHIDLDKSNNCLSNLEWCTKPENHRHAVRHDRFAQKMTREKVAAMRAKRLTGATYQALADEFGVNISNAWTIVQGTTWSHV